MSAEEKDKSFQDQSVENEVVVTNYNCEERRLESFISWPVDYPVNPTRLAKSGFYYAGSKDEVICFSCSGHISHWQYGDIVQKRHMELFPHCDFINNKSNNIPFVSSRQCTLDKTPLTSTQFSENNDLGLSNSAQNSISSTVCKQSLSSSKIQNDLSKTSKGSEAFANSGTHNCEENDYQLLQASDPKSINFPKMLSESERLKTFKFGWPLPFIDVTELARAGFFFLGSKDKVQCAFCRGIVKNWEAGDIPIIEHTRHFPDCEFVLSKTGDKSRLESQSELTKKGYDVCGNSEPQCASSFLVNSYKLIDKSQHHTKLEELGVNIYTAPIHPQQATLAARLRSFISWPSAVPVKKEDLADAGFFYIGISDHTKCFHCDGGLCSWEPGDDPWIEHGRWFRNCNFVRISKGDDFIKSCVAKHSTSELLEPENKKCGSSSTSSSNAVLSSDSLLLQVEQFMKSSLVSAVLETGLFPPYLIRAAIFHQLSVNGSHFNDVDQICETIEILKKKIEGKSCQISKVEEPEILLCDEIKAHCTKEADSSITTQNVLEVIEDSSKLESSRNSSELTDKKKVQCLALGDTDLEEENRYLRDQRLCKVCMDKEVGVVFLPCGHLLSCTVCAPSLKDCPMCRKPIRATVRAYLP